MLTVIWGMSITNKIFFPTNPGVSEIHGIRVTSRQGATVSSPIDYDVVSQPEPDASAGLGVLWMVMVRRSTGDDD